MPDSARILVTGAGGPAGIAVILELARIGITTIGCDIDPFGAGLRLANESELLPPFDDAAYFDELVAVARHHSADGLIVTMTEEMAVLAPRTVDLGAAGLAHWLPPAACVDTCLDKLRFAEVTEQHRQPVPATAGGSVDEALAIVPGPWIIKPRFGRGSRQIFSADDADAVRDAWPQVDGPILQTRLAGREFTVDVLVDHDGALVGAVPRFRLKTESGISTAGRTFAAQGLDELVAGLLNCVGHRGPANVQGFLDDDGTCVFSEINPRFSGGLPLSLRSGSDLVGEYVRGIYGLPIRAERLAYRPGTLMIRHWAESIYVEADSAPRPVHSPMAH